MEPMPLNDALFLMLESRQKPFHVGSLQLFRPPDGLDGHDLQELYQQCVAAEKVLPIYQKRVESSFGRMGWVDDELLDLEYHVRHSALPHPGRIRELLALVSRLHGTLLDRSRPLWETHLIEGLSDGRFAIYAKIHHAVVDGIAGMRLVQEALSEDPEARDTPPPWADRPRPQRRRRPFESSAYEQLASLLGGLGKQAATLPGIARGMYRLYGEAMRRSEAVAPFQAPMTILNRRITGARRFAAQSWPFERIRAVGKAVGGTLNDAVLAMCSGALRKYLLEQDALPETPLVAMIPVSIRPKDEEGYGNAVSAILANLATNDADPARRLDTIRESMAIGKDILSSMSRDEIVNLMLLNTMPMLLAQVLGLDGRTRPPFNVTISNVPGPRKPLYWNGARLDGIYPVSIVMDGQALNITVTSYVDNLEFGLIGCRRTLPSLQRMLTHLEDSLVELEDAVGIRGERPVRSAEG